LRVFSQGTELSEPDPHPSAGPASDLKPDESPREVEDSLQLSQGSSMGPVVLQPGCCCSRDLHGFILLERMIWEGTPPHASPIYLGYDCEMGFRYLRDWQGIWTRGEVYQDVQCQGLPLAQITRLATHHGENPTDNEAAMY